MSGVWPPESSLGGDVICAGTADATGGASGFTDAATAAAAAPPPPLPPPASHLEMVSFESSWKIEPGLPAVAPVCA